MSSLHRARTPPLSSKGGEPLSHPPGSEGQEAGSGRSGPRFMSAASTAFWKGLWHAAGQRAASGPTGPGGPPGTGPTRSLRTTAAAGPKRSLRTTHSFGRAPPLRSHGRGDRGSGKLRARAPGQPSWGLHSRLHPQRLLFYYGYRWKNTW